MEYKQIKDDIKRLHDKNLELLNQIIEIQKEYDTNCKLIDKMMMKYQNKHTVEQEDIDIDIIKYKELLEELFPDFIVNDLQQTKAGCPDFKLIHKLDTSISFE